LNDDKDLKDQIAFDGGDFERLMVSNVFFSIDSAKSPTKKT